MEESRLSQNSVADVIEDEAAWGVAPHNCGGRRNFAFGPDRESIRTALPGQVRALPQSISAGYRIYPGNAGSRQNCPFRSQGYWKSSDRRDLICATLTSVNVSRAGLSVDSIYAAITRSPSSLPARYSAARATLP